MIAELARQVRSALIEVLASQYIRTLRAKGLGPVAILWKHGLRNISVTLLTILGLQVNRLLLRRRRDRGGVRDPGRRQRSSPTRPSTRISRWCRASSSVLVIMVILSICFVDILNALLDPRVAEAT